MDFFYKLNTSQQSTTAGCAGCEPILSQEHVVVLKLNTSLNSTSAGTLGEDIFLPENLFNSKPKVYDLAYSKSETPFNLRAKKEGSREVYDGLGMLIHQAALSFEIWNRFKPSTKGIEKKIRP